MMKLKINCPHCHNDITLNEDEIKNIVLEKDLTDETISTTALEALGIYLGVVEKGGE